MATHMPMATARQPFAPLNGSRLQNLTSLKNRQNALVSTLSSSSKRKATVYEDDSENIDPIIFLSPKRSKGLDGTTKDILKPATSQFFLTKPPPSLNDFSSSLKPISTTTRPILQPRSPAPKLNTAVSKSSPLSAPAGRSPTRKRIGILSRRKTASPFTRVDPPKFSASAPAPTLGFSIDAALSGTIPSYGARQRQSSLSSIHSNKDNVLPISLHEPESKSSWFFDIHEDTPEELATNLMEHSTCTLDISSDEESKARKKDGRGKENVPPLDDVSQTRNILSPHNDDLPSISDFKARIRSSRRRREIAHGAIDIDRSPLGEMAAEDFYAEGCDCSSVILVDAEAEMTNASGEDSVIPLIPTTFDFTAEQHADCKGKGKAVDIDVDELMTKDDFDVASKAALLCPIEKAEEGFEVWESGSAKGDE